MADEMISRQRAGTVRLVSQSAAAVLVAGSVLLVVLGSPLGGGVEADEVAYGEVESRAAELSESRARPETDGDEGGALPPDMDAIKYSLQQIENVPTPPEPKNEEPPKEPDDETPTEPAGNDGRTRFLGVIEVGERMLALLSAGGAQRILGEGDSAVLPLMPGDQGDPPEVTVHEVTSSYVRLAENGADRQVDRAARVGIAVSQSTTPVADSGRGTGGARDDIARREAMGEDADADRPINPDDYRREDGTIDYESLRAAARAKARARRDRFRGDTDEEDRD